MTKVIKILLLPNKNTKKVDNFLDYPLPSQNNVLPLRVRSKS